MIKKYNQYINERICTSLKDGVEDIVYYTDGLGEDFIKKIYQLLFDNGFYKGSQRKVDNLTYGELNCTFLLIMLDTKQILHANINIRNNDELINNKLSSLGYRRDKYFIKEFDELRSLFSKVNINTYSKKNKLVYESLLDHLKGPDENELLYLYHFDTNELGNLSGKGYTKIDTILSYRVDKNSVTDDELLNAISELTPTQQMIVSTNLNFKVGLINAIDKGADIHADNDYCYRAACYRNDYEIAKIFLERGVSAIVGLRYIKGNSPLRDLVIQYDWKETVKNRYDVKESLLDKLEGPSKEDILNSIKNAETPEKGLVIAVKSKFYEGIDYVLKCGADINYLEGIVLRTAIFSDDVKLLKYLIYNGGDINNCLTTDDKWFLYKNDKYMLKVKKYIEDIIPSFFDEIRYDLNESLLNHLEGPSKEDILTNFKIKNCKTVDESIEYIFNNMELVMGDWTEIDYDYAYSYLYNEHVIFKLNTRDKKCYLYKHYFDTILNIFNIEDKVNFMYRKLIDMDIISNDYLIYFTERMDLI